MALETLLQVERIDGNDVAHLVDDNTDTTGFCDRPIFVDHPQNIIAFKIQKGPIKEVGVNGCQVDALIEAASLILIKLNKAHPCDENMRAIEHLLRALDELVARRRNREQRGVEGTSQI